MLVYMLLYCYLQVLSLYSYPDYLLYFVTKENDKFGSYRYFCTSWFQQTSWRVYSDVVLIRSRVKCSFRVSQPPLQPWFSHRHGITVPGIDSENRPADDEDDGSWCCCKEEWTGEMIACDKSACPNVWYYLACLKMATAPKEKWLCPSCHASSYHLKRSCTQVTAPNNRVKK